MDYLRQVQRGIDYIEARLDSELEIEAAAVAHHAGISHWHFQPILKALTNETLKTYIRARRFANALDKLATTDDRILEIAMAAGFESQEGFTRAFKKAFGLTPASYRKRHTQVPFLRKLRFDSEYLRHIHQNLSLSPEIYAQPELRLVGLQTRFFSVDSEKNNIAHKLPGLWQSFLARLPEIENRVPGLCYGIVQQTPEHLDELEYLACIAVTSGSALPSGMIKFTLPAAQYAKFAHRGNVALVDRTVSYIYSSRLAQSGMRHTYGADIEFYGAEYSPDSDGSVIHYAIPIAAG